MSKPNSVQWFLDKLIEHRIIIVNKTTYGDKVKTKYEILLEQAKGNGKRTYARTIPRRQRDWKN